MSAIFSIVAGVEWVLVHDVDTLFAATDAAGIARKEVESGMREWEDGKWFVRTEVTKRIPKARPSRVKAGRADTPEARKGRVHQYANFYASVPEAHTDKPGGRENPPSPLDG